LQKQTNRLKTLNTHLEKRLQSQEKRMGIVTVELSKTWNMVGRMQRQHRQLHTNEQVLRYQLFQKRRLLNELKEELEYCRRKWTAARQKNNDTEEQWKVLRTEFTNRKLASLDDANQQSAESGYSGDEQMSDDDALERKPKFVDVKPAFSDVSPEKPDTPVVKKPRKPETAEQMFMRLTGQSFEPEEPAVVEEAGPSTDIKRPKEFVIEQDTEDLFDLEVPLPVPCSFSRPATAEPPQSPVPLVTEEETSPAVFKLTVTEEEYLDKRQRRLERLEREAAEFHKRMSTNKERSSKMCTKLDDLHDRYSQSRKQRNEKKSNEAGCSSAYRRPRPAKMDGTIKVLSDAEIKYTEDRASRIQSLEEQCTDLLTKIRSTTSRGSAIAQQLDSLHERSVERAAKSRFGPGAVTADPLTDTVDSEERELVEPNSEEAEFDELIENAEAEWHAATNHNRLEDVLFDDETEGQQILTTELSTSEGEQQQEEVSNVLEEVVMNMEQSEVGANITETQTEPEPEEQ
jgi:chromosome segregation ATPase